MNYSISRRAAIAANKLIFSHGTREATGGDAVRAEHRLEFARNDHRLGRSLGFVSAEKLVEMYPP